MLTDVITLVKKNATDVDEYGDVVNNETRHDVFAEMASIGTKEFYQAAAVGLQPEVKFILSDYYDYDDERFIDYNGARYSVLRTFRKDHELELVCTREVVE